MKMKHFSSKFLTLGSLLAATILVLGYSRNVSAQWTTNVNDVYKTNTAGNVGIGTTTPAVKLDVAATSANAATRVADFYQPGLSTTGTYGFISVGKANAADSAAAFGFLMNTAGNDSAFITVAGDDPSVGTGLFVRKGGSVGIGTTAPGELFHIRKDQNAQTRILLENQTSG